MTISEIVLIVCLVRKQLLVSVGKQAAEKIVIVFVGKLRCHLVVSPVGYESHSSSNKRLDELFDCYRRIRLAMRTEAW